MKFILFAMIAAALLLFGCTGGEPQNPPAPPSSVQGNEPQNPPAPPSSAPAGPNGSVAPVPTLPAPSTASVTSAQLSSHNIEADCWVAYEGQVYDITSYIPNHKNYQALLVPLCGTSSKFQQAFEGKHGQSKVSILLSQGVNKGALLG